MVRLHPDAPFSAHLTLLSLQGLVNRGNEKLYLDLPDDGIDTAGMLAFLTRRYNVTHEALEVEEALARFLPAAAGLFVYDPGRPESVNIGTLYAGLRGWVLAGPDNVEDLQRRSGLPVQMDYGRSDWASLSRLEAYDRALRELYPEADSARLAILPPEALGVRDYLVATKTFVFYHPQGPTASPADLAATVRVLRAAPRNVPVLGWFHSPTEMEENAFVQLLSQHGKYLVGGQAVPNLSVLTSLGRGEAYRQPRLLEPPRLSPGRTYAVVAIPDGDNLDFVAGRMRAFWDSPVRGALPLTWSLNPLLAELAPPYLAYYTESASPQDAFVAAPSGAGYLYPDYTDPVDLDAFLEFSGRYLAATDLDVVWLLNAFPAYEVPYRPASLARYVERLAPRGLVLDYADEPTTRAVWMVAGGDAAAPVIRSTHFWTTQENLLAKVQAAAEAWDGGSRFLWITVYPFLHGPEDAWEVVRELEGRLPGGLEIVTPDAFFDLLSEDFRLRAAAQVETMASDPLATALLSPYLATARTHLEAAQAMEEAGEGRQAAFRAYLAIESLREAARWRLLLSTSVVVLGVAGAAVALRRVPPGLLGKGKGFLPPLVAAGAGAALFFVALRAALDAPFWTYPFVGLALVASLLADPLERVVAPRLGDRLPWAGVLLLVPASAATLLTPSAFPLALLGGAFLLRVLLGTPLPSTLLPTAVLGGFALGFLLPTEGTAVALLAAVLVLALALRRPAAPDRIGGDPRGAWFVGWSLSLPLVALAASHYQALSLRLELRGEDLAALGAILLALAGLTVPLLAVLGKEPPGRRIGLSALAVAAALAGLLLLVSGAVATGLTLFALTVALTGFGLATLNGYLARGGELAAVARPTLLAAAVLLLLMRLPPIAYSLLLPVRLPWAAEYALYSPALLFALMVLAMLGGLAGRAVLTRRGTGDGHD